MQTEGSFFLVAGLPKSGNVWLTSLIAKAMELPVSASSGAAYVDYTHQALTPDLLINQQLLRGVVLVRDLRDVVVSLYHWLKTEDYLSYDKHGPHQVFDDIESMYIEYFLRRFANIPIATLMDNYVKLGWPVVKYERLCDNAFRELQRLFAIWAVEMPSEKISDAVAKNDINVLRKSSKTSTVHKSIKPDHFRAGGYGNFKQELPEHICIDIEKRYGDYLRSWGYITTHS